MLRHHHAMRSFESPDGVTWTVEATLPGASNVMLIFHHPDERTASRDRYAWYNITDAGARDVTARADARAVVAGLTEPEVALLFRRSMLVSAASDPARSPVTEPAL